VSHATRSSDAAIAEHLIAENLPWIRALARRFHRNEYDDLVQVGSMAVLRFAKLFDAGDAESLRNVAANRVLNAMRNYLRGPYRSGKRVPLFLHAGTDAVEQVAAREAELPPTSDDVEYRVIHREVRPVVRAVCRCGATFLSRVRRDHEQRSCSVRCARSRLQRSRTCVVCGMRYLRWQNCYGRRRGRCLDCVRARRRKPAWAICQKHRLFRKRRKMPA